MVAGGDGKPDAGPGHDGDDKRARIAAQIDAELNGQRSKQGGHRVVAQQFGEDNRHEQHRGDDESFVPRAYHIHESSNDGFGGTGAVHRHPEAQHPQNHDDDPPVHRGVNFLLVQTAAGDNEQRRTEGHPFERNAVERSQHDDK